MCKEVSHLPVRITRIPSSRFSHLKRAGSEKERVPQEPKVCSHEKDKHHRHDDLQTKAHEVVAGSTEHDHSHHDHSHHDHKHHLHDDVVSLAHRHHDHQNLPLMQQQAAARSHSCHAGDGHNHGETAVSTGRMSGITMLKPVGGNSANHHHEDEHEHCPKCDEHLVDNDCPKCGYKHIQ